MTEKPINILHLEDDLADAELIQETLQTAEINCAATTVKTRKKFCDALRSADYDVILADYHLPAFDGMSALQLAREQRPDIPFIFVSGTLGEDAAINGLTEGATDYVPKAKLTRLVPAIMRALREAENRRERKRAEKVREVIYKVSQTGISAENLDELYRSIHALIGELLPVDNFYIALYDPASDILSFPYFVDQYDEPTLPQKPGHGLTEYVLRNGKSLLAPPDVFDQLVQQGEAELVGTNSIDWLGVPLIVNEQVVGIMVVQSYTEGVRFGQEDVELLEFVSTQVAQAIERKRAEERLAKERDNFLKMFAAAPVGLLLLDSETVITQANHALADIVLRNPVGIIGQRAGGGLGCIHSTENQKGCGFGKECNLCPLRKGIVSAIREDSSIHGAEIQVELLIGNVVQSRWLSVGTEPIELEGKRYVVVAVDDITERKRAEEALQAYGRQQTVIAELGQSALKGIDLDELMDDAVTLVAQTLTVEYCKVLELLPRGDALLLQAGVGWKEGYVGRATVGSGADSQAGFTLLSDTPVVVEDLRTETRFNGPPLLFEHGVVSGMSMIIAGKERPFGVLGAHTTRRRSFTKDDVHFLQSIANVLAQAIERKQAEEALKESQRSYQRLVEQIPGVIYQDALDENASTLFIGPQIQELTGYTPEEWQTDPNLWLKLVHPDDRTRVLAENKDHLATGEPFRSDYRLVARDGRIVWVRDEAVSICDALGQPLYDQGVFTDITERKRAEESLRRLNRELVAISNCNEVLVHAEDEQMLLNEICRIICEEAGYRMAWVGYAENDDAKTVRPVAWAGYEDGYLATANITWADTERGRGPTGTSIRNGETVRVQDWTTSPLIAPWREDGLSRGYRSNIALPLKDERAYTFGTLSIYSTEPNAFTSDEIHLLEQLSADLAFGITTLRARAEHRRNEQINASRLHLMQFASTHSLDELLEEMLNETEKLTNSMIGFCHFVEDDQKTLTLQNWSTRTKAEFCQAEGKGSHYGIDEAGVWVDCVYQRRAVIHNDYASLPHRKGMPKGHAQVIRELVVPVIRGEAIKAILGVGNKPTDYNEQDIGAVSMLADLAWEIAERKRAEENLRRRTREAETLRDATTALTTSLDLNHVLDNLFNALSQVIPYDSAVVFLHEQDRLHAIAGRGFEKPENVIGQSMSADNALYQEIVKSHQTLIIPDVQTDPRYTRWGESDHVHGWLGVPLIAHDHVIGQLTVDNHASGIYNETHAELALAFANQAATALENARLFDETRRRLAELDAVNRISTALRTAQTLDEMLPCLLDETLAMLNAGDGIIYLHDATHNELRIAVARGALTYIPNTPRPADEGLGGMVITARQPFITREFTSDPRTLASARQQIPPGWGGVGVPIFAAQEIVGVLFVAVPLPREITTDEAHLLTTLAEIAGNAMHRSRLHEQTGRRLEHVQALHAIDMAISGSIDLRITLDVLLEHVTRQLRLDAAAVLLLKPGAGTLEYAAGHGFRGSGIRRLRLRLGEDYAGQAALEQRMVSVPNLKEAERPFTKASIAGEEFVAYYGMPLVAKGQVKGVLEVFHRAPLDPDEEWLDFLETLAGQTAVAIDNAQLFTDLQRSNLELGLAYDATIEGWSHALDLRDRETEGHSERVTEMTERLARAMGMSETALVHVRRGALLHDIGKMGVPDDILLKPDKLTDEEWAQMRQHPQFAYDMLVPIAYLRPALDIPYCHHEKWDGTGYPRGLKGEEIPLAARIFAVVDMWDALTSNRPYRAVWSKEKALEHIKEQSGKHFDTNVVSRFLQILSENIK